jgi:hypothetical protein
VVPYLPGLAGGELGADTIEWIDAHLAGCASCRRDANRQRSLAAGLASLSAREVEPPAFLVEAIVERTRSERSRRFLPVSPVIPAEIVRVVQDNREALASVAGVALAAAGAYAIWRAARATRAAPRPA